MLYSGSPFKSFKLLLFFTALASYFFVIAVNIHKLNIIQKAALLKSFSFLSLTALFFVSLWAVVSAGTRHLPFWITLFSGIAVVIISMKIPGSRIGIISKNALFLTGFFIIAVSRIISGRVIFNASAYYAFLISVSLILLAVLGAVIEKSEDISGNLSYSEGKALLMSLIHPEADKYVEDIDDYINKLSENSELNLKEKEEEIRRLNEKISEMEEEAALYKTVKEENEKYKNEIESLKVQVSEALKKAEIAASEKNSQGQIVVKVNGREIKRVTTFAEAVEPDVPIVRDFAVALASSSKGSYYRDGGHDKFAVSEEGIQQIVNIHRYISGEWKYVNDPADIHGDYYSPASRTIAAGLAGDCDDFSILVSSAVEAIGGKTRIMGGTCSDSAHAWSEVYIGSRRVWNNIFPVISRNYPGRKISYRKDSSGKYWLSLDWNLGEYTCGDNPEVLYQRIRGVY